MCLQHLACSLDVSAQEQLDLFSRILPEVILCTKESNGRAREAAFDALTAMGQSMIDAGGDYLFKMLQMILAGLAAETPYMRSGTVYALSRLLYTFIHEAAFQSQLHELIETIVLLLREKNREVVKAAIGFVKVVSVCCSKEDLQRALPSIVTGLLQWAKDVKDKFRLKIRFILERLIRRCGFELVAAHVPESDEKLMKHISKMKQRDRRRKAANKNSVEEISGQGSEKAATRLASRTLHHINRL